MTAQRTIQLLLDRATDEPWAQTVIALSVLILGALLIHLLGRKILLGIFHRIVYRSQITWDEVFFEHRTPHRASLLIPLGALWAGLRWVPGVPAHAAELSQRLLSATMIAVIIFTISSLFSAGHTLYQRGAHSTKRPIKSYIQLAKVLLYLFGTIFVIARVLDQSPWFLVSGLGAMMALVVVVFRDTLLSLVASMHLTNGDLVRVGDWIEMPTFNADGEVVDIALHTVKVQNWDKTFSVIPTHKFLEHSFKNWRGMSESGGRRMKRAVHINTSTVRFLTEEEMDRFGQLALLNDYIEQKRQELREHNERVQEATPGLVPNARRLTNLGTLRAYIAAYLKSHPKVHKEMTQMVRQLEPTPEGVPIEVYAFCNETEWTTYESVQSDVFDHILSMVPEFDLSVYQRPSGRDLARIVMDATD